MTNSTYITQSSLIAMGWTKSMISKFMPDPKLVPNPRYKNAAPMKLYDHEEALNIMDTDEELIETVLQTKKEEIYKRIQKHMDYLDRFDIRSRFGYGECEYDSFEEYQEDYEQTEWQLQEFAFHRPNDDTLNRWCVNHIRHRLTSYNTELVGMTGKIGKDSAYHYFKKAVLEKIAEAYPKYKDECFRQIGELDIC